MTYTIYVDERFHVEVYTCMDAVRVVDVLSDYDFDRTTVIFDRNGDAEKRFSAYSFLGKII